MHPLRTFLCLAAGLAVFILACGQEVSPTEGPTVRPTEPPTDRPTVAPTKGPTVAPAVGPQNRIPVYEIESTWGNTPASGISFTFPNGIAGDSFGNVYVTEFRGNRVQKFTSEGLLLTGWGSEGSENGQFQNPTGIAIDGEGKRLRLREWQPSSPKIHRGRRLVGVMGLTGVGRWRVSVGHGNRRGRRWRSLRERLGKRPDPGV